MIYPSAVATIAYDPTTGKELWTVYHDGMNASARPIFGDGLVFITNGMGSMVAVSPTGQGDVTGTHIAWSDRKGVAKKSSQLFVDGLFYMISDDGVVSCREPKTGDVIWQQRVGGDYAASPIYAGGRIYLFSRDGEITTIEPGREYKLLAETTLGDGFMASPAVVGNEVYLRSKTHLYCVTESRAASLGTSRCAPNALSPRGSEYAGFSSAWARAHPVSGAFADTGGLAPTAEITVFHPNENPLRRLPSAKSSRQRRDDRCCQTCVANS